MIKIAIKRLTEDAVIPEYAHDTDAGMDLYYSGQARILETGKRGIFQTGLAIDIPAGYVGLIHPRSGLALKHGLTVLNAPGTIDPGYQGEVKVILMNHSTQDMMISKYDRIAQLVIQRVERVDLQEVDDFQTASARGEGGFGSTGN